MKKLSKHEQLTQAGLANFSRRRPGVVMAMTEQEIAGSKHEKIPVTEIDRNPWQPRRKVEQSKIEELARSISENQQIEPIIVRAKGERYELVAGERRLLAHKNLGRTHIEAIIRHIDDGQMAMMSLVENMDREDLTDYEIGMAIARAANEFKFKKDMAEMLSLGRTDFYRFLAFSELPVWIQERLDESPELLSKRAAEELKAFLKDKDPEAYREVIAEALNKLESRELENNRLIEFLTNTSTRIYLRAGTSVVSHLEYQGKKMGKLKLDTNGKLTLSLQEVTEDKFRRIEDFLRSLFG